MLKLARGDCASRAGLVGANHAQIRWNFARSDCKSRQALHPKSGVWEDMRMLSRLQGTVPQG